MKKLTGLIIAAVMAFALSSCGRQLQAPLRELHENAILEETQASAVSHINQISHSGNDDFTKMFECKPSDGNQLDVYIQNHGTDPVLANITWENQQNKEEYPAITIQPNGGELVQTFSYDEGSGIDGEWTVNVAPEVISDMNITVTARQYTE